ncbi:phosphoribosylglycinamide formyltransferase, partial [Mycobacterium sp. ITM-2017-0098]
ARVVAVGTDRVCTALDIAGEALVPTFTTALSEHPDRSAWDAAVASAIAAHNPDIVISAGFMKILGPQFISRFTGRVLNTHPALLPAFPG